MNIRQACEAVVNASPSDYEAACEVWTRVCTPQAVLAALPGTCGTCKRYESDGPLHLCHRWKGGGVTVKGPDDGCIGGYKPKDTP